MLTMYCVTAPNSKQKEIKELMSGCNKNDINSFIKKLIASIDNSKEGDYVSLLYGNVSITIKKEAEVIHNEEPAIIETDLNLEML